MEELTVADPKDIIDQAYELFDAAHVEEALELVRPLMSRQSALSHDNRVSLLRLVGRCSLELGDYERARQAFDSAARIAPDLDRLDLAISFFYLCGFDEAEMILDTLTAYPEVEAEICWYRGLIAERRGDFDRADSLFRRAAKLDRRRFVVPHTVEYDEVREMYDAVLEEMPPDMRVKAVEVPLIIEDLPNEETLEEADGRLHPLILGLYVGTPLSQKSTLSPSPDIDRIVLFRRNIAKFAHNAEDLRRELRHTIIHEIGHHFGMSEEELEELGY
jgi:predicted Zn-dependent protease with MMP-like domain